MNIKHLKNLPYQFAFNQHNEIVHISTVQSGLKCNCFCASCGVALVARKGQKNIQHFAHHSEQERDCAGGLETELHLRAKAIIERNMSVMFPMRFLNSKERQIVPLETVVIEVYKGDRKPDLIVTVDGHEYLIEIAVTHFSDSKKKLAYREMGVSAFEIDLSNLYVDDVLELDKEIEQALMTNSNVASMAWVSLNLCSPIGQQVKVQEHQDSQQLIERNNKLKTDNDKLEIQLVSNAKYLESKKHIEDKIREFDNVNREISSRKKQLIALDRTVKNQMETVVSYNKELPVLHETLIGQHKTLLKKHDAATANLTRLHMKVHDVSNELSGISKRMETARHEEEIFENKKLEFEYFEKHVDYLLEMLNARGCDVRKAAELTESIHEIEYTLKDKKEKLEGEISLITAEKLEIQNRANCELKKLNEHRDKLKLDIETFKAQRDKAQSEAFKAERMKKQILRSE